MAQKSGRVNLVTNLKSASMPLVKSEIEKWQWKKSESEHGIEQTKVKENKSSDILHGWSSSMHLSNTHILVASERLDLTKGKNINKEDRYDLSNILYSEN